MQKVLPCITFPNGRPPSLMSLEACRVALTGATGPINHARFDYLRPAHHRPAVTPAIQNQRRNSCVRGQANTPSPTVPNRVVGFSMMITPLFPGVLQLARCAFQTLPY